MLCSAQHDKYRACHSFERRVGRASVLGGPFTICQIAAPGERSKSRLHRCGNGACTRCISATWEPAARFAGRDAVGTASLPARCPGASAIDCPSDAALHFSLAYDSPRYIRGYVQGANWVMTGFERPARWAAVARVPRGEYPRRHVSETPTLRRSNRPRAPVSTRKSRTRHQLTNASEGFNPAKFRRNSVAGSRPAGHRQTHTILVSIFQRNHQHVSPLAGHRI